MATGEKIPICVASYAEAATTHAWKTNVTELLKVPESLDRPEG